jgi:hypothetical protein
MELFSEYYRYSNDLDAQHADFIKIVEQIESEQISLNEGFFSDFISKASKVINGIPQILKEKFQFIKDLAVGCGLDLLDLLKTFKDKYVFKFFSLFKFNLGILFKKIHEGFKIYTHLIKLMAEFVDKNGKISKVTDKIVHQISDFLHDHPAIAWGSGAIMGALALYIWFHTCHVGHPVHDFDLTFVIEAFLGKITFADLFGGTAGIELLISLTLGSLVGVGMPWTSLLSSVTEVASMAPSIALFVTGIIMTIAKHAGIKVKKIKMSKDEKETVEKLEPEGV